MVKKKKKSPVKKEISKFYSLNSLCPHCNSKLENSVNEDYIRCNNCFSHFKKEEAYIEPDDIIIKDHYIDDLLNILESDKNHFDKFFNFNRTSRVKLIYSLKERIISFGGGFPKLESYLKPKLIKVYDLFPKLYSSNIEQFRNIFDFNNKITFNKLKLDENSINDVKIEEKDLITFVHILEHFHYDQIVNIFKNLPKNIIVIIYSPNSGRQPTMDKNWLHFVGRDHITLLTLNSMVELIERLGYNVVINYTYDCDMFIVFKT